jgi:hypothetical protein
MRPVSARNSWRRLRLVFRWCRIGLLLLVMLLLLGGLYLHHFGVPGPVRDVVVATLRSRGVELDFGRLRLHWYHGLVADGVSVEFGRGSSPPRVWCQQVAIHLNWRALLDQQVEVTALELRGAQVTLPLAGPNEPAEDFVLEDFATRLRWGKGDTWHVEELTASVLGASLQAHGTITNGPALWRRPRATAPGSAPAPPAATELRDRLRRVKRLAGNLTFSSPPELRVRFSGDAADATTWAGEVQVRATAADTPWGRVQDLQIQTRVLNAATFGLATADLRLEAGAMTTAWGNLQSVRAKAGVSRPWSEPAASRFDWEISVAQAGRADLRLTRARLQGQTLLQDQAAGLWATTFEAAAAPVEGASARAGELGFRGRMIHSLTNAMPRELAAHLVLEALAVGDVRVGQAQIDVDARARDSVDRTPPDLIPWAPLASLEAGFSVSVDRAQSPQLAVEHLLAAGHWAPPELTLTNVQARLLDGTMQVTRARFDVATREAAAEVAVDFDVQRLDQLLPAGARQWLAQFGYEQPPHAVASARVRLPPRGARPADLGRELLSTLDLQVRLDGRTASYRGLRGDAAGVTLSISNQVLRLRDLAVIRPEGRAALAYDLDLRRRDFRWRIDCELDPHAAAPAVDPATLTPIVGLFEFTTPPRVTGEVWGNWNPPRPLGLALTVSATNFTFRGEAFDSLTAGLQKTNEFISASEVRLTRGDQWVAVPWVRYDLTNRIVALTNARSRMDPLLIARCIGTNLEETLRPYRFARPPEVVSAGVIPVSGDLTNAAMTFEVAGEEFGFWRFNLPQVTAGVRWHGDAISVTNVAAGFYGGRVSGGIDLELLGTGDALFRLQALATDFDLQALMRDVMPSTNRLEGRATVSLIVTDAHTADWGSWYGRGQAEMRDGLIWDLPVFGMFSTVMNVVIPGIGNSRASAAKATYQIQKSVIHTEDLAIAAGPARLQYKGSVDFDGRLDARVMAEVLHGTPLIGPLISLALTPAAKAMEFKVTGTLAEPVIKPLYVPGFFRPFLNPVGALQNLFAPSAKPAGTPAPAP